MDWLYKACAFTSRAIDLDYRKVNIFEIIINFMSQYYFDIETTGLNPQEDKIISIQIQELDRNTGEKIGELIVLKEWESSEREILEEFIIGSGVLEYPFNFIPVGYNLGFEHNFLVERTKINKLPIVDILNNPFIDLHSIGVLMNRGEFRGSGLDKITGKKSDGSSVPDWYKNKEFNKILEYVESEADEFIKLNVWLFKKMPEMLEELRKGI